MPPNLKPGDLVLVDFDFGEPHVMLFVRREVTDQSGMNVFQGHAGEVRLTDLQVARLISRAKTE